MYIYIFGGVRYKIDWMGVIIPEVVDARVWRGKMP